MNHRKNKLPIAARIALGLIFSVFGLNGFLHFLPQPPPAAAAVALLDGLAASGYMFPLIKGTELVAGLLLLSGRAVPFALTLLAPVVVNIVAFHLFLDPSSLAVPLFTLVTGLYLAWTERAVFAPLFGARAADAAATRRDAGAPAASAA